MLRLLPSPTSICFIIVFILIGLRSTAQNAWINEIHYENTGTDVNEFVEVVLENPGTYSLANFTISLYNGTTLTVYNSKTLNQFITGNSYGNFTVYYFIFPTDGIQNGPDGVALDYQGTLIQLLSYEGVFTPHIGPANGFTSQNISVNELPTGPIGFSLQLFGSGDQYTEFFWNNPADDTPGSINNGQTFTSAPTINITAPAAYDFKSIAFGLSAIPKSFNLIGANVNSNITINIPTGFQLSLTSDFSGAIYSSGTPKIFIPTAGTLLSVTLYVRFTPPAASGLTYSGNVTLSGGGAVDVTIAVTGTEGGPNAWINEFHYDDIGVDANEFVELIIRNSAAYNLNDFKVSLYNGGAGTVYDAQTVDLFVAGQTQSGFSIYSFDFSAHTILNIQNGPDGIALSYQGNMIMFISYEGVFTATDGPALGNVSQNIGFVESNSTADNSSIYLNNTLSAGSRYSDFTWAQTSGTNTRGMFNLSQTLPVTLINFTGVNKNSYVQLNWATASEKDNKGFHIQKCIDGTNFVDVGFVAGSGNKLTLSDYAFIDYNFYQASYYRITQEDANGNISFPSHVISIEKVECSPMLYVSPNPVTNNSRIYFYENMSDYNEMTVTNSQGINIISLRGNANYINTTLQDQVFSTSRPGIYFLKLTTASSEEIIKVVIP